MLLTKDRNPINETSGIKSSYLPSQISNIFDDANNYSASNLSSVNTFRASDRTTYTPGGINTPQNEYVVKSNDSNNSDSQEFAVAALQPDLIVRNVSNPTSAAAGSTIQLNYEILNQGSGSADYSYTKFYLSKDLTLGNSDDVFLNYDYVTSLLSNYYSQESTTLTISDSITAGTYYLVYQADGYNYVAESNESNNAIAGTINITKPDLILQNAVAPSSASVGSTISVSYQVKNQGNANAGYSFTNFYLSQDLTLDSNDKYIGYDYVADIAGGISRSESTTLTIDSTINAGNYYLIYHGDGDGNVSESNENNNAIGKLIAINPAGKPDLIVQNASAPSSASVSSTIQLSYQVKNQGVGSAIASTTNFYLSKDNAYSTDDVLLGSDAVNSIAAGATSSETVSLAIANTIATGNYYLLYRADADNKIAESNESNNVVSKAITITKADLIIQNAVAASSVSVGGTINISYQVKNQDVGSAIASTTRFYLSKDNVYSTDDVLLGSDAVNTIAAGATSSETASLAIANTIAAGNYYLLYRADADNKIAESNETNNLVSKAIAINGPKPDLVIQNISAPTSASIGKLITLNYQLKNQGTASAATSTTRFYLSKDATLSSEDTFLYSDLNYFYSGLSAGSYSSESTSVFISSNTPVGNYYLLFQADSKGEVSESNENNNVTAKAITITAPDLVIQNFTAPTSAAIGTTIKLSYQIKNQGNGNAGASSTYFYLSRDTTIGNNDDISIGYHSANNSVAVAASAVISQSTTWTINTTIAPGKYYLMVKADGFGDVTESNENNNAVYITAPFTLTPANGGGFNSTTGYGLINAAAAVAKALGQTTFADVPDLGGDNWGADAIKAPEVWVKGYTGQGVIVAVVDSGVDYNHSDLSANIWKNSKEIAGNGKDDDGNGYIDDVYGWNFVGNNNNTLDSDGHGTHVAGTIAAVKNNFGVTGIAYNAKIMPVRVFDDGQNGSGSDKAIANGIRYAVNNGALVINLSLGGPSPTSDILSAIQYAVSKGAIVVSAAGNDSKLEPAYPARYADKFGLAVGAVYYDRTLTDFSHRAGTNPLAYVTAPGAYEDYFGIGIYSTVPGNKYDFKSGTSMAAPHVAGVVALMLSAKKGLTDAQVRQILTTTSGNGVKSSSASLNINSISDSNAKLSSLSLSSASRINSVISNYSTERKVAISNLSPSSNKQSEIANFENPDKFADQLFWEKSVKFYDSQDGGENSLAEYDWEQLWD